MITTAPGPRFFIWKAAVFVSLIVLMVTPLNCSASALFGVTTDACGSSSFLKFSTDYSSSNVDTLLDCSTGSITVNNLRFLSANATLLTVSRFPSIPVFTPAISMSSSMVSI